MVTANRRSCLFRHIDARTMRGLEIGPYCNPTVRKDEGDIRYLDFYTREELLAKEADRRAKSDVVVDVDYVVKSDDYWRYVPDTFDYVIANHVFEHVDNPVQWVCDLGRLLNDRGVLFLTLPDKKYNFDRYRADTTVSHLLTDYYRGHGEPREHGMDIWIHYDTTYLGMPMDLDDKLNPARLRAAFDEQPHPGRHNHVFQSETFVRSVLRPLQKTGIWEYTLLEFAGAPDNHGEFYVVLRKGREPLALRAEDFFVAATTPQPAESPATAAEPHLLASLEASQREVARLRQELATARAESAALRASLSWRVTGPVRSLAGALASLRPRRN